MSDSNRLQIYLNIDLLHATTAYADGSKVNSIQYRNLCEKKTLLTMVLIVKWFSYSSVVLIDFGIYNTVVHS